jgi:hypothetical protein
MYPGISSCLISTSLPPVFNFTITPLTWKVCRLVCAACGADAAPAGFGGFSHEISKLIAAKHTKDRVITRTISAKIALESHR